MKIHVRFDKNRDSIFESQEIPTIVQIDSYTVPKLFEDKSYYPALCNISTEKYNINCNGYI